MTELFIKQEQDKFWQAYNSLSQILHIADDQKIIFKNLQNGLKSVFIANYCIEKLSSLLPPHDIEAFLDETYRKAAALSLGLSENASPYQISNAQNLPDFDSLKPLNSNIEYYNGNGEKIPKNTAENILKKINKSNNNS